jgi:hypothetical protein
MVEGYPTKVWTISDLGVLFTSRKEHLSVEPLPFHIQQEQRKLKKEQKRKEKQEKKKVVTKFVIMNPDQSSDESDDDKTYSIEELEIEKKIQEYRPGYRHVSDLREDESEAWRQAQKTYDAFKAFRPSLNPPITRQITYDEFLKTESSHLGRPIELDVSESAYSATMWMYEPQGHETDLETISFNRDLVGFLLDLFGVGNHHLVLFHSFLDKLNGFPVQMDIPMPMGFLSARVIVSQVSRSCLKDSSFFEIPEAYREGDLV